MSRMTIRATYALDQETDDTIRQLAGQWGVSQAEVVRRSIREAAERASQKPTPAEVVAWYREQPLPRTRTQARQLIENIRRARHAADEDRPIAG